MSFGYSAGDFLLIAQLAYTTYQNARRAWGAHDNLTREVRSVHTVPRRLHLEVSKPESILSQTEDSRRTELAELVRGARSVIRVLSQIVEKYNALPAEKRSIKKLWQSVRFGNGEMKELSAVRSELATYTQNLNIFLNLLLIGSQGKVEKYMDSHGEELREIKSSLNWVVSSMQAKSTEEKSILTTYNDDDKGVWKDFRRELVREGFSSRVLSRHKTTIRKYILELGDRGVLDDAHTCGGNEEESEEEQESDEAEAGLEEGDLEDVEETGTEGESDKDLENEEVYDETSYDKDQAKPGPSRRPETPPAAEGATVSSQEESDHEGLEQESDADIESASLMHNQAVLEESSSQFEESPDSSRPQQEHFVGIRTIGYPFNDGSIWSAPQPHPEPGNALEPSQKEPMDKSDDEFQHIDSSADAKLPHGVTMEGVEAPEQISREEEHSERTLDCVSRRSMQPSVEEIQDEEFMANAHPNCMAVDEVPRSTTPSNYEVAANGENFELSESISEINYKKKRVSPSSEPDAESSPVDYATQLQRESHTRYPQLYWFEADREDWVRSAEKRGRREERYLLGEPNSPPTLIPPPQF